VDGKWKARKLEQPELQESEQYVGEIEKRIGEYPKSLLEEAIATPPPTPPAEVVETS
jgi:hypothetical protein